MVFSLSARGHLFDTIRPPIFESTPSQWPSDDAMKGSDDVLEVQLDKAFPKASGPIKLDILDCLNAYSFAEEGWFQRLFFPKEVKKALKECADAHPSIGNGNGELDTDDEKDWYQGLKMGFQWVRRYAAKEEKGYLSLVQRYHEALDNLEVYNGLHVTAALQQSELMDHLSEQDAKKNKVNRDGHRDNADSKRLKDINAKEKTAWAHFELLKQKGEKADAYRDLVLEQMAIVSLLEDVLLQLENRFSYQRPKRSSE